MLDAVPLIAVTAVLIGTFSYFLIKLQLEDIRAHWEERRCEFFVIPMAHMVPDGKDPNIDPSEFAVNNFQYCIKQVIQSSIKLALAPMLSIFSSQVKLAGPINDSKNYLLSNAKSLLRPLTSMMDGMWGRFRAILFAILRGFIKMFAAYDRIAGVATASIFAGISSYKAIQNAMNFVIKVVVIILTVLLVIVILLFFLLIPVLPVILTVIGVISASVFGGLVGGMAEQFCVAPGTLVCVKGGAWKPVETLVPGEELHDGSVLEGVLKTKGGQERLVVIDGVCISACHLVQDSADTTWKPAGKHPLAKPYEGRPVEYLYCLNTSNRIWSVKGDSGRSLGLRDWEELPLDMDSEWESYVHQLLNDPSPRIWFPRVASPGRGVLGPESTVYEKTRGTVLLSSVQVGDFVRDQNGRFTEVLAVYADAVTDVPKTGPNAAAWVWDSISELWGHVGHRNEKEGLKSYHLITKSGTFVVNGIHYVRDFTEVGIDRIGETYDFVLSLLAI